MYRPRLRRFPNHNHTNPNLVNPHIVRCIVLGLQTMQMMLEQDPREHIWEWMLNEDLIRVEARWIYGEHDWWMGHDSGLDTQYTEYNQSDSEYSMVRPSQDEKLTILKSRDTDHGNLLHHTLHWTRITRIRMRVVQNPTSACLGRKFRWWFGWRGNRAAIRGSRLASGMWLIGCTLTTLNDGCYTAVGMGDLRHSTHKPWF